MKKKQIVFFSIITLILLATFGLSYAYFNYAQNGVKTNSVRVGDITFKYTENNKKGNGINIEDGTPISDSEGKELAKFFEFTIDSKLSRSDLKYEVVVEPTADSTMNLSGVKFYLTEVDGNNEEIPSTLDSNGNQVTLVSSIKENGKVKVLSEYDNTEIVGATGKTVYQEVIQKNTKNYTKTFRARVWIDEDIDWTDEGYVNTIASFKVNVYANSDTSMASQTSTNPTDTSIQRVVANNKFLLNTSNESGIDYDITVPNEVEEINFSIYENNLNADSTVTRMANLGFNPESRVMPIANEINTFSLNTGANYFKITVTASDNETKKDYIAKVTREESADNNLLGLSIDGYSFNEEFSPDTTTYHVSLEEDSINISGTKSSDVASISGNGIKNLTWGENTFEVTVTAENGIEKTYTIIVNNVRPDAPAITGGTGNNWVLNGQTVELLTTGTAISGIKEYEYVVLNDSTLPTDETPKTGTLTTSNPSVEITTNGTNYVYFRTVSNANHRSVWSSPQIVNKDDTTYTVTYNLDGGTISNEVSSYNVTTETFTLVTPTKEGYTFTGWTGSNGETPQLSVSVTKGSRENKVYTANYTANTYTVTFDKENGTGGTNSITATYDSNMPEITLPTKENYTFDGYYDGDNGTGTKYYNADGTSARTYDVADDITLYAKWNLNAYIVTYNSNGGNTPSKLTDEVVPGGTITSLSTVTRDSTNTINYVFDGWYTDPTDGTQVTIETVINSNITVYAHWLEEVRKYQVIMNGNNIVFSENAIDVPYGGNSNLTVIVDTGYYVSSATCTEGYTLTGLSVGSTSALDQTVIISNNNNAGIGSCTFNVDRFKIKDQILADNPEIKTNPDLTQPTKTSGESGLYSMNVTTGFGGQSGTTYYFRGSDINNSIKLANLWWRIVRINEDGTVRIVTRDSVNNKQKYQFSAGNLSYDDTYYSKSGEYIKKSVDDWFDSTIPASDKKHLVSGNYFCESAKVGTMFDGDTGMESTNTYVPSFECPEDFNGMQYVPGYVGLLTYDEVRYAGAAGTATNNYYLNYGGSAREDHPWTMSPAGIFGTGTNRYSGVWYMRYGSWLSSGYTGSSNMLRPVVILSADTIVRKDQYGQYFIVEDDSEFNESLVPGLYDDNNQLVKTWSELENLGLTKDSIETDYTSSNYHTLVTSPYKIFSDNALSGKLVLPSNVTKIGNYAFYRTSNLKAIIMRDGVTSIGNYSFGSCSITTALIPDTVISIGSNAFFGNSSLNNVKIPDGVLNIGSYAFYGTAISSLEIPDSVTTLGSAAFSSCNSLKTIKIGSGVSSIANDTFNYNASLEHIFIDKNNTTYDSRNNCNAIIETSTNKLIKGSSNTVIPEGVASIDKNAFNSNQSLTSIRIPSSVNKIDSYAFSSCTNINNITFDDPDGWYITTSSSALTGTNLDLSDGEVNVDYLVNKYSSYYFIKRAPGLYDSSNNLIKTWSELEELGLTKSVIEMDYNSNGPLANIFIDNDLTGNLLLPGNINRIGNYSFSNISGLNSIVLSTRISSIGNYAFSNCLNLVSIEIPNSVQFIGEYAFKDTGLISAKVANQFWYSSTSSNALSGTDFEMDAESENALILKSNYVNRYLRVKQPGLYDSSNNLIKSWSELESLGLSKKSIETNYTYSNYNLDSTTPYRIFTDNNLSGKIVFSNKITKIGQYAFYKTTNITDLKIPSTTEIGSYAFSYCTGLTNLTISSNIADSAFSYCTNLSNVTLKYGVNKIYSYAFSGCTNLTSITIPSTTTEIASSLCSGCTKLSSITVDSNNIKYDSRNNCNAVIRKSDNLLLQGCKNTVIPDTVVTIGGRSFASTNIASINIPSSVTTIGSYAFAGNTSLTSITIPSSVTKIESYAFNSCSSLTKVTFSTTTGWYAANSNSATTGTDLTLTNTSTNATYLTSTYVGKYWKRN